MNSSPRVHRLCPLCEATPASPVLRKEDLTLVRCESCGMVYVNPVSDDMAGAHYNKLGESYYLSPEKLESDYAGVRFERELRLLQRFCPRGTVLDVGCSTGAFLFQLKSLGDYQVVGTDVSMPALEHARSRGLEIVAGSFLEHDFGATRFDAVTFWAVMEHLLEPKKFLIKAGSLLKSGGFCFILVPNMKSLAVRLLGARYRYIYPEHINYFTARTLRQFSLRGGPFELLASGSMHFNPIVIGQDFRGGGGFVAEQDRAALLKRTTTWKQNPLLWPVKTIYTGVERVLGSLGLADNLFIVLRRK